MRKQYISTEEAICFVASLVFLAFLMWLVWE